MMLSWNEVRARAAQFARDDTGRFKINVGGELVHATPSIRSFYDPKNQRVRPGDGP